MSTLVKKLDLVLTKALARAPIIPVKTEQGIIVGNVLIENHGNLKNLWQDNKIVYEGINLNVAAIKIANNLAKNIKAFKNSEIYLADQEYGRWLIDSQIFFKLHKKAITSKDFDKADVMWARYCESKYKCDEAKDKVNRLSRF